MKKPETFSQKWTRVHKELNALLQNNKKITQLTDDQRIVLLIDRTDRVCKYFEFPNASNKNAWDADISPSTLTFGFKNALQEAVRYAKDAKLIDPSYSIGDNWNTSIMVVGFRYITDQKLIDSLEREYREEQRKKEREKKETQQAKKQKTMIIGNKKYKLLEIK